MELGVSEGVVDQGSTIHWFFHLLCFAARGEASDLGGGRNRSLGITGGSTHLSVASHKSKWAC